MEYLKLNKKLVLVSCRFDVGVCVQQFVIQALNACCLPPQLPPPASFLAQPCSVYITDVPLEALEANVPEQCQHEV